MRSLAATKAKGAGAATAPAPREVSTRNNNAACQGRFHKDKFHAEDSCACFV
jgi:hypothetical protein